MSRKNILFSGSIAVGLAVTLLLSMVKPEKQKPVQQVDKVPLLSAADLDMLLDEEDERFVLLDTRSPEEYRTGRIKNARFVNFETFRLSQLADIPKDKEIIVYCLSGGRSNRVGMQLLEAGYLNVRNLEGGIRNWKAKGYPITND